jgi:hypothetical protein
VKRTFAALVIATSLIAGGCTVTQTFESVGSPKLVNSPQPTAPSSEAKRTPLPEQSATPNADAEALAANACAGTSYSGCVDSFVLAMGYWPGELVAICEYGDDQGDIVWVDTGNEADADAYCSADGLIAPSEVFNVAWLP